VLENLWEEVNFYLDKEAYDMTIAPATQGQRAVFAIEWYRSEVNNGGHHQFLDNSTGMVWQDALVGFKVINAPRYEEVFPRAINQFDNDAPSFDRLKRMQEVGKADRAILNQCDDEFYKLGEDPLDQI
jgi:hypothetical protein